MSETISDEKDGQDDSLGSEVQETVVPMSDEARARFAAFDARNAELLAIEHEKAEKSLKSLRTKIADLRDNPARDWLKADPNGSSEWGGSESVSLPLELRRFITPQQLAENAAEYPEMTYDIGPELLKDVKIRLMRLPLVHRTNAPRLAAGEVSDTRGFDNPVPHSWVKQQAGHRPEGNTYGLDQQADLDEFVFMSWGGIYGERGNFLRGSRHAVLIDPNLLLDPHCVVTPTDIAQHAGDKVMKYGLSTTDREASRELRDKYFGKMVTGRDWLGIESRRIAKRIVDGQATIEDLGKLSAEDLGEVKFFGEIPRSSVIASLDTRDSKEYDMYREYIGTEAGFELPRHGRLARRYLR